MLNTNSDGVAESLDHFMSLQVKGSENTDMVFNPAKPTQFTINVQHPESTLDEVEGMGDAIWLIDIKDVVAPPCSLENDHEEGYEDHGKKMHHGKRNKLKTCSNSGRY